jgi:hypothetical protein
MRFLHLLLSTSKLPKFIKNYNLPVCKNCIHFIEHRSKYNNVNLLGKCKLFGEKDIITGIIEYEYVVKLRIDSSRCDINGNYYEEKNKTETEKNINNS